MGPAFRHSIEWDDLPVQQPRAVGAARLDWPSDVHKLTAEERTSASYRRFRPRRSAGPRSLCSAKPLVPNADPDHTCRGAELLLILFGWPLFGIVIGMLA